MDRFGNNIQILEIWQKNPFLEWQKGGLELFIVPFGIQIDFIFGKLKALV